MPPADRIDTLEASLSRAHDERDTAYIALAEIEALVDFADVSYPVANIATVLRRFRLDLTSTRQRQYDREVAAAWKGRHAKNE